MVLAGTLTSETFYCRFLNVWLLYTRGGAFALGGLLAYVVIVSIEPDTLYLPLLMRHILLGEGIGVPLGGGVGFFSKKVLSLLTIQVPFSLPCSSLVKNAVPSGKSSITRIRV